MNKKFWFIVLLTFVWFTASTWWYLCRIKQTCPSDWGISWFNDKPSSPKSDFQGPIAFSWNSATPQVFPLLDSTMSELMDRMGPRDTLIIVGTYFEGESGPQLGLKRAESLWQHLTHYVDYDRIKTEFAVESFRIPEDTSAFEAIQFRIAKAMIEPESEQLTTSLNNDEQTVFKLTVWFRDRTAYKIMTSETESSIQRLIDSLKSASSYRVDVIGHTDEGHNAEESDLIGRQRAWAIKKILWDGGLDPSKIHTDSKGGNQPVSADPAKNQRVEIFGIPYK
ncbi:MAG: OmpA family protein [Bacteroidetes bacterium]|nr:OmpA family protein [Bacteroidota bacterium]